EGEVVVCLDELLLTVFGEQHVDERGFLLRGALPSVAVQITRERVALRAEVLAEFVGRPVELERDGRDLATDERQRHVRDGVVALLDGRADLLVLADARITFDGGVRTAEEVRAEGRVRPRTLGPADDLD